MNHRSFAHPRLRSLRGTPHYLAGFLAATAQRHALIRPCVSVLLESRLVQGMFRLCLPATITMAGTHSVSGATTEVTPTNGSPNPASGQTGANFSWFFTSTGAHRALSYTVSGLPAGLTYKYGSPVSSITGKPTTAGTSRITIKGWEKANRTGASTPTYTLTLNVTSPAPVITSLSTGGEYPPGAAIQLTVAATGAALTYQWLRDGTPVDGATTSTHSIAALSAATAGTYTVKVTSGGTTVTSDPIVITMKSPIDAWKSSFWSGPALGDPAVSGLVADPDGDGLENVLEYVLDLDPTALSPDTPGRIEVDANDSQFFTYTVPLNPDATDYSVRFERSAGLTGSGWIPVDETDPANLVTRSASQLSIRIPRAGGGFLRLVSIVR